MKFIDGNWLPAKNFELGYSCNIFDYDLYKDKMVFYLSERPMMDRHTAVSLPYNTETIDSPMEGVIRVNLFHFAGGTGKKPSFDIHEQEVPEDRLSSEYDEEAQMFTFRTGDLVMKAHRSDPFLISYYGGGKMLTSTGIRSDGYMQNTKTGQAYMAEELSLNVGDKVYGLGERFSNFVKNGQSIDIWNEDGGSGTWQAYKNIPFYITSAGYGVFINTPGKVSLEIESQRNFRVGISVPGEELEYFIIYGGSPKAILEKYTALTGRAPMVPAWSYGLWLSTSFTTNYDEKTVTGMLDGMKQRDIPLSVFHFDCFWMRENEWCNFKWDERCFPDPEGMLKRYHERGLKICVWLNSYIGQKSYLYKEGAKHGYLLKRKDGTVWQNDDWQSGKAIVDFTNPEAVEWYKGKLRTLLRMGVDAFKTDFGERIPTDVEWFDHTDPERMHNYYTYLYNKAVYYVIAEVKGKEEAIVFARSATAGSQQFPVHWGGDSFSNYPSMAETLRAGLSFGLSGFGYWSHDIGGFEATSTADVYKRWVQFGLLSSHSRLHGSQSYRVPWNYDEEASAVLKYFVNLKMRLMPYLYMTSRDVKEHGWPIMRAMLMEFPEDETAQTLDRQYMLGDSLLVAPIFNDQGICSYYLPEGRWIHLLSKEIRDGGRWYTDTYDYFSLPLYVREGSILPIGAVDDRPDYDYEDGITFILTPPAAPEKITKTIVLEKSDKTLGSRMTVTYQNGRIEYDYENRSGKPFKLQIDGKVITPDGNRGVIE